jgi:hypothetical protein
MGVRYRLTTYKKCGGLAWTGLNGMGLKSFRARPGGRRYCEIPVGILFARERFAPEPASGGFATAASTAPSPGRPARTNVAPDTETRYFWSVRNKGRYMVKKC